MYFYPQALWHSYHKYGLVTLGVGWIVWRDAAFLPAPAPRLRDTLPGRGGAENSLHAELLAPRPGTHVVVQYYNLAPGLPVVAFRFAEFCRAFPRLRQELMSLLMRARQWIIPSYALPPGEDATGDPAGTLIDGDEQDLSAILKKQRPADQSGPIRQIKGEAREESREVTEDSRRLAEGIYRGCVLRLLRMSE
ncbi:glutamate decarboxylase gad1 [Diatrype stigma]|uniref:Glutamate decarboxylase gad1 n=1 Tax=Diatrype stigma TaxID=117547 RepID=A0AAN9YRF9_9PEZI